MWYHKTKLYNYTYSAPVLGMRSPRWISNLNFVKKILDDRSLTTSYCYLEHKKTNSRRISVACIKMCGTTGVMDGMVADWWPFSRTIAVHTVLATWEARHPAVSLYISLILNLSTIRTFCSTHITLPWTVLVMGENQKSIIGNYKTKKGDPGRVRLCCTVQFLSMSL